MYKISDDDNSNIGCINITNIFDVIIKVLCMCEECPGLRHDIPNLNEFWLACNCIVHRFCIKAFSNIEIIEAEPMYTYQASKETLLGATMDMTAKSDKKQRDENGRRFRKWR